MHKEFILGSFLAKMPSYQSIQSVLNFMWGKGHKLDIRTNLKERTIIVRIPNDYIRSKVLEKKIWYVGTAMFHVSPWSASGVTSTLNLASISLWAHLKGLPLDLRSLEGLSFAARLIGEPKETDEFTKNLTDISIAHVKVEANLTSPLPTLIELRRTSGEVYPVEVEYPWVPTSCCFCHQIGHILKDCLTAPQIIPEKKTSNTQPSNSEASKTKISKDNPTLPSTPKAPPEGTINQTDEENQQMEFESDLQEILSPAPTSPPNPMDEDPTFSLPVTPLPSPTPTLPMPSPRDSSPQDLINFTSSTSAASHVVGLPAIHPKPKRLFPFKHKPSFKKSNSSSQTLSLKNPFQILGSLDSPDPSLSHKNTPLPTNLSISETSLPSPSPFNQVQLFAPKAHHPPYSQPENFVPTTSDAVVTEDPLHPNEEAQNPSL